MISQKMEHQGKLLEKSVYFGYQIEKSSVCTGLKNPFIHLGQPNMAHGRGPSTMMMGRHRHQFVDKIHINGMILSYNFRPLQHGHVAKFWSVGVGPQMGVFQWVILI